MRLADRYTRFHLSSANGRIPPAEIIQKVIDTGDSAKALNWALSGSKDGGARLQSLRRNLRPEEWDAVAASVWDDLGKPTPGKAAFSGPHDTPEFSPQSFVTNWNNTSEEARNALFRGTQYAGMADDMVKIGKTAQRLNDSAKQANFSNSANVGVAAASIYGMLGMALKGDAEGIAYGVGAGVVGARAAAKLMSWPPFVNFLAQAPTQNTRQIAEHLGRLTAIAAAEPAIRDEVRDFESALREAPAIKAVQRK